MLEMNWKQFWTEDWNLVGYRICEHEDRAKWAKPNPQRKFKITCPCP